MRKLFALLGASVLVLGATYFLPSETKPASFDIPLAYSASVDYFLKIEGVEGESTDERNRGGIDIESFSWGVSQAGLSKGGGGAGGGKASFQDFHFTKRTDKSSPVLFQAVPEGKHFKEAIITARKPGESQAFMVIKFSDVLISSFEQSGGGDAPTESLSLNYSKIEFDYLPQKPDGTYDSPVHGGWDLKANKKL